MDLPTPVSLDDVITDGVFLQAAVDAELMAEYGPVTGVEFNGPHPGGEELDAAVSVRIHRHRKRALTRDGTRIATVKDGEWTWLTTRTSPFEIPELHGTHPADDRLIAAARTVIGNAPVFLAPHSDSTAAVVALDAYPPVSSVSQGLLAGLSRIPDRIDERRALTAFGAALKVGMRDEGDRVHFSDGTTVLLHHGRIVDFAGGVILDDVLIDAWYPSAEHQIRLSAMLPGTTVRPGDNGQSALLSGDNGHTLQVRAEILATINNGTFRWAWADPAFEDNPASSPQSASGRVRQFGRDHAIPALFRPQFPAAEAEELHVVTAAKPITNMWTHIVVDTGPGAQLVLLLEAPALQLPPPSEQSVRATLPAPISSRVEQLPAVIAYARFRGLQYLPPDEQIRLMMPDTHRELRVTEGVGRVSVN